MKGIVDAVPVYSDAIQPAAKEVGKSLLTVAKTINVALAPIGALVWGYDRICEFLTDRLAHKLAETPPADVITPSAHLAGPALEALRFVGEEADLREMYATLLATAMDRASASRAHPAFVEIIKQLSPDEAKLLTTLSDGRIRPIVSVHMATEGNQGYVVASRNQSMLDHEAGVTCPELVPSYLDNLCRLGLTEIPSGTFLTTPGVYDELENDPAMLALFEHVKSVPGRTPSCGRGVICLTDLGKQFIAACITGRAAASAPVT